jgi:hypothetical protein
MARQTSNVCRVLPGRNSSNGVAVLDRAEIGVPLTDADDRLQGEPGRTGQFKGNIRQLRALARMGAGKVEDLITQTYIGDHEEMKLAVDTIAVVLDGLQMEMARLTEASR